VKSLNKRYAYGTGETRRALLTSELRLSESLLFWDLPYILESNPHPNLIRTSFLPIS